jgi:ATP-dependent DNA helicase RecG
LKGVGPAALQKLERLGIRTISDLLFHLPTRYQDRTRVLPIGSLRPGDEVVVEGAIQYAEITFRRRRMLLAQLSDNTGSITLRFFHFSAAQQQGLAPGTRLRCFGEARRGGASLEMVHPEYRPLHAEIEIDVYLTPVYPITEGLHQAMLRKLIAQALGWLVASDARLIDHIPLDHLKDFGGMTLKAALLYLHRPPSDADLSLLTAGRHPAQKRLAFEELLAHQLSLMRLRASMRQQFAPPIQAAGTLCRAFENELGYALTGAQRRVIDEIMTDLHRPHPMLRLVQGDVGAGKTVVAAAACLYAVEAGYQAAIMAPTEVLAEQHYRNMSDWFRPLGLKAAWLSGKLKVRARKDALAMIESGRANIVVGTHALFQEHVRFHDLALVVVDEQHRFGVHQRLALRDKGEQGVRLPHQLIMTATPIPRTLAMTAYADLDYSVIDELPPGRQPIKTVALADIRRNEIIERISQACGHGRQAYWVCTLIEESEVLQCRAAEDTQALLSEALRHLRIGLLHGRMKPEDKQRVMAELKAQKIDLLVATTVIEVGVDVPSASLMIIENAERLGLAQLHQLRGRIGRGEIESSCVLLYRPPLSDHARQRLDALRHTNDGFEIAHIDLKMRGPGEVLGTRQTGVLQLRIADIMRDQDILPWARAAAKRLIAQRSPHVDPLIQRWLGESLRFGRV